MFFFFVVGFDVGELSSDGPDDIEGLDATAAHVANLLSTEPANSKFPRNWMDISILSYRISHQCV